MNQREYEEGMHRLHQALDLDPIPTDEIEQLAKQLVDYETATFGASRPPTRAEAEEFRRDQESAPGPMGPCSSQECGKPACSLCGLCFAHGKHFMMDGINYHEFEAD